MRKDERSDDSDAALPTEDAVREVVRDEFERLANERGSSGPSVSRRGALTALGIAGAGAVGLRGSTGTAAAVTDQAVNAKQYNGHVYMVGDDGYTTVQKAHDAIPSSEQGVVHVTDSYDTTQEDYPIEWTKRARLTSDGKTKIGDPNVTDDHTLEVNFELPASNTTSNRNPGPMFDNLQLVGGKATVYVRSARFTTWYNVDVNGAANNGFRFSYNSSTSNANNSHVLVSCTAEHCGLDGFSVSSSTHAVNLVGCTSQLNGRYGAKIGDAYACSIHGGAYQNNDDYGIRLIGTHATTIHNAYIEKNCLGYDPSTEADAMAQVWIGNGADACHVEGCYLNSDMGNSKFACIFNGAYRCSYRNNLMRSDNDQSFDEVGHVSIISGEDIDVYETSNTDDFRNAAVVPAGYDNGTNTLSFGQPR